MVKRKKFVLVVNQRTRRIVGSIIPHSHHPAVGCEEHSAFSPE